MTKDEAMRIALEALVNNRYIIESEINLPEALEEVDVAITALRQALEQPRQECETCANKRRRLEQAGFLKSPLRGEEKQFFYGQDPNVLPALDRGEINDK